MQHKTVDYFFALMSQVISSSAQGAQKYVYSFAFEKIVPSSQVTVPQLHSDKVSEHFELEDTVVICSPRVYFEHNFKFNREPDRILPPQ